MLGFSPLSARPISALPEVAAAGAYAITVTSASVTLAGTSVSLKRALRISVSTAAISATGSSVSLKRGLRIAVTSSAVTLTGSSVSLRLARAIAANTVAVVLSGTSVNLKTGRFISAGSSAVILTGSAVNLTYSGSAVSYSVSVNSAAITLTGSVVNMTVATASAQSIGGSWLPIQYVGGKKPKPAPEETPLAVTEQELNEWLESLRAPILREQQIAAAIEALKSQIMGEVMQAELQGLAHEAMYAAAVDEEENDLLLLSA